VDLNPSFTKKLDGNNGPLDGRWQKTNENNKDSQVRQVTHKKTVQHGYNDPKKWLLIRGGHYWEGQLKRCK